MHSLIASALWGKIAFGSVEPSAELESTWSGQDEPVALHCYRLPWQTSAISLGLLLVWGPPWSLQWASDNAEATTAMLPRLCAQCTPPHTTEMGTLGNHWVFLLGVAHRTPPPLSGMGCVAFDPMSSMVCSSENKEERWQCSNAFITFITFTSVTRKLIARYLYSPFPFPPLPPLLLRYIRPLWRALGFVSQYLM